MRNFKKFIFLLLIFINCKSNINNNNFKPCLKTDYINYIKSNNLHDYYFNEIIFCTSKYLKHNDYFDIKIFVIPCKYLSVGDTSIPKIVLYELNKNKILRSYLYPSIESRNFRTKLFETGFVKITEIDSSDLSIFQQPNAPKELFEKFIPPDSFVFGIFPYYDSSIFNKSIILNNTELDSINLNINKMLLHKNLSSRSRDYNYDNSSILIYEYFEDAYFFQIKKDSRFIQIDISKSALMKLFQEIFKILDAKFKN